MQPPGGRGSVPTDLPITGTLTLPAPLAPSTLPTQKSRGPDPLNLRVPAAQYWLLFGIRNSCTWSSRFGAQISSRTADLLADDFANRHVYPFVIRSGIHAEA